MRGCSLPLPPLSCPVDATKQVRPLALHHLPSPVPLPPPTAGAQQLPNVGREGHTFLAHLHARYDSLAEVTLFVMDSVEISRWDVAAHHCTLLIL